jgi:hypothetical protein
MIEDVVRLVIYHIPRCDLLAPAGQIEQRDCP